MYECCWLFFVYAFLGWCTEVSYAALVTGRFVNRGFLNGPVCPIYGFGVLLVVGLLTTLKENTPLLFLGSVILTSALEWLGGFALERLFHQRWWDYSDEPFNINGYICLRFSVAWGLACLLVMEVVHPVAAAFVSWCPRAVGMPVLLLLDGLMAVDMMATVRGVIRMNRHLEEIDALAYRIRAVSDEIGQSLADRVLDLSEKGQELKQTLEGKRDDVREELQEWKEDRGEELARLRRRLENLLSRQDRVERRLLQAFPKMKSHRYKEALERWKHRLGR